MVEMNGDDDDDDYVDSDSTIQLSMNISHNNPNTIQTVHKFKQRISSFALFVLIFASKENFSTFSAFPFALCNSRLYAVHIAKNNNKSIKIEIKAREKAEYRRTQYEGGNAAKSV